MSWLIGIDEAGYGPNLGPFVSTLVACRVPDDGVCLWERLKESVRRHDEDDDGRLVVADSKEVYSPAAGLGNLETTVLAAMSSFFPRRAPALLTHLVDRLARAHHAELRGERWYAGDTPLPARGATEAIAASARRLRKVTKEAEVELALCRSVVVCAPRFNELIERWDSKAVITGLSLVQLLESCLKSTSAEPMSFVIDKLGGRNQYHVLLQEAFHDGIVFVEEEGAERSLYRVEGLDRPVRIRVVPRADAENFCVALASMVSKYLRELFMLEFNRFWQQHVPDIKPTAGYPGDATRFFEEIRPALAGLGLQERQVWRCR